MRLRPRPISSTTAVVDPKVGVLSPGTRSSGEIVPLTSLRGVAAMAVVMQHFSATAQQQSAVTIPSLVPHGYLAVDLFFTLSGFIMSYTYLDVFQRQGAAAFPVFLGKRVARIVPLNTAVVLLILVAGAVSTAVVGRNIIANSNNWLLDISSNLLLLQGLGIGHNLNGPSWSISTEFLAYLLFPVLTVLAFSRRAFVWGATMLGCVLALAGIALTLPRLGLGVEGVPLSVVRCVAEFTLGIGCYRLSIDPAAARRFGRDAVSLTLIAACLAFMLLRLDLPAALLFPALIASLAVNRSLVARMMSAPWLRFLGVVSFSVYLVHQVFRPIDLELLRWAHPALLSGPAALLFALVASLAVVPFAWLAYFAVERPGRVFVRYLLGGAQRAARQRGVATGL